MCINKDFYSRYHLQFPEYPGALGTPMPRSHQQPLTAPRRGPSAVHDFTQKMTDWKAAVFDNADHFVVMFHCRPRDGRRHVFLTFTQAVACARGAPDQGCVYAVAPSGRFCLIDRERWDEWLARQARRPYRAVDRDTLRQTRGSSSPHPR